MLFCDRAGVSARRCIWSTAGMASMLAMGLALAGCTTSGQPTASLAVTRGTTVAFESIEGPPSGVFRKLVDALAREAENRDVAFVSRDDQAQFRIRGYMAAHIEKKRTTIAWVWDVYDSEQRRALRLTGERPADGAGTGWSTASDSMMRQIARDGMDRLAAFLAAPDAEPLQPAIPDASPTVAVSAAEGAPATMVAAYSPRHERP